MNAVDIAERMPDVPALLDRCRGLGMTERILQPSWPRERAYVFERAQCGHGGWTLTMYREGQKFSVHFHEAGVLVYGWDRDSPFTWNDDVHDWGSGTVWPKIMAQIPEELGPCLRAGIGQVLYDDEEHKWHMLSLVTWRLAADSAWRSGEYEIPSDEYEAESLHGSWESSADLLVDLLDPSPSNIEWSGVIGPDSIDPDDPAIGSVETGMSMEEAIRHILALRPLTEQVVRTLNPDRGLADVADDITAVGYPQPDAEGRLRPLGSEAGPLG
ncbi:hypothetical protein [Streptomyces sp. NPDC055094]